MQINVRFFINDACFINHYRHCGEEWEDVSESMNNDQCPECETKDIEPYESEDETIREVTKGEFLEAEGVITYERHTVFANGVAQICLTKVAQEG